MNVTYDVEYWYIRDTHSLVHGESRWRRLFSSGSNLKISSWGDICKMSLVRLNDLNAVLVDAMTDDCRSGRSELKGWLLSS